MPMAAGWKRIWAFLATRGLLDPARAEALSSDGALEEHTLLPQTRASRSWRWTPSRLGYPPSAANSRTRRGHAKQIGGLLRCRMSRPR